MLPIALALAFAQALSGLALGQTPTPSDAPSPAACATPTPQAWPQLDNEKGESALDLGNCLFVHRAFSDAIAKYETAIVDLSRWNGDDHVSREQLASAYYHQALAYKAVGDKTKALESINGAKAFTDLLFINGDPYLHREVEAFWQSSGEAARTHAAAAAELAADHKKNRAWAASAHLSADETRLVTYRGIPCKMSSYDHGDQHFVAFWYCNADGVQTESYTFLNGKEFSHFDGG